MSTSRTTARRLLASAALIGLVLLPAGCKHGGDSNGGADGGTRTNNSSSQVVVDR